MGMKRGSDEPINGTVPLAMYQDLLARYDALVREVMALKREGFAAPVPYDVAPHPEAALEAPILQAIEDVVEHADGDGTELERQLTAQAWRLKRASIGAEAIAQRITAGEEVPV